MEIRSPYKQDSFSSFYKNKEGSYPNSKININSYYFGSNSNKKNIIENNRNNFQNIPQEHLKAKNNLSIINETMSNYYSSDKKILKIIMKKIRKMKNNQIIFIIFKKKILLKDQFIINNMNLKKINYLNLILKKNSQVKFIFYN